MKGCSKWSKLIVVLLVFVLAGSFLSRCEPLWDAIDGTAEAVTLQAVGDDVVVNPNAAWKVNLRERVSACDNRPGLKKIYVTVLDEWGEPLRGVIVRFETHASEGIAYDHLNVFGYTNADGYIEWDHLGIPTRYMLFMEDDEVPLVENIRTDLRNEYCKPPGGPAYAGNVPVNRPGVYSWRIEVQLR